MRVLVLALALIGCVSTARAEDDPLAPIASFVGCWRGSFAGAEGVFDERCIAPMLGGRYVRDRHVVRGGGDYAGEAIYAYDPQAHVVTYVYFAADGGQARGSMQAQGDGLYFPNSRFVGPDASVTELRTTWTRTRAGFVAVTEAQHTEARTNGAWREIMRISYVPAPDLAPAN